MKTKPQHTPTPLTPVRYFDNGTDVVYLANSQGETIATFRNRADGKNNAELAAQDERERAFIVRAVNLHEIYAKTINEIKEQLMYAEDRMAMLEAIEKSVDKAIAKAEGK